MTPAQGIAKFGFRRWYERELIEGHVYLVTGFLSFILIAACVEQINWRGPPLQLISTFIALALGAALCLGSLRRFNFMLARAECFGEQSSCEKCKAYGVLKVIGAGAGEDSGSVFGVSQNAIEVYVHRPDHGGLSGTRLRSA